MCNVKSKISNWEKRIVINNFKRDLKLYAFEFVAIEIKESLFSDRKTWKILEL